ncbi:MAG: TetR/AcrR family transcriptional regulator [Prevotellaceae bacterium]|jgi:AcrR family transcriptional regulator|nr:TetR/AcrR family transcriptional regulator [Prevotellaceae bacterium]
MDNISTQEKILLAAEKVFSEKGFGTARMRDISAEAGVNLALINYHYKSKENLYAIIMRNKVQGLFGTIISHLIDEKITLEDKINFIIEELYKVVSADLNLPMFVFSELQKQDSKFVELIPAEKIKDSAFLKQISARKPDVHPLHYVLDMLGMFFFPYLMTSTLLKVGLASPEEMNNILKERVKFIPQWIEQLFL